MAGGIVQTRWRRIVAIGAALAFALFLLFVVSAGFAIAEWRRVCRESAIEASCKWARLEALPTSAREVDVQVEGGFFTREFIITFRAPLTDLAAWADASPGLRDAQIDWNANEMQTIEIEPGGGAQFAEVKLGASTGRVRVRTYWS